MRLTQLFTKTRKDAPADEIARNAQLLIRAGFIHKDAAGVYLWLPLGRMVLNNIIAVIRAEMDNIGGQEVVMSSLQRRELWETTDRWDDEIVDVWFKTTLKNGTEAGLAWSHEEQMVDMMRGFTDSYRNLPQKVYQFQTKLRNETRAKSGIMRTREFVMKDMYSFARSDSEHDAIYEEVGQAYRRIFDRLGIGNETFYTFASGGAFAEFSHEFQTICDAGEDIVYINREKGVAINEEVMRDDVMERLGITRNDLEAVKTAEVGNIFSFGTSKSEPMDLRFADEDGADKYVVMGSYGIGPARVMGVIVELLSDDRGIVWPEAIAPARIHLVRLGGDDAVVAAADSLYSELAAAGVSVLYDDRDVSAGAKFADADLMGLPWRVTVSARTVADGEAELKGRTEAESRRVKLDSVSSNLG